MSEPLFVVGRAHDALRCYDCNMAQAIYAQS